MKLNIGCGFDYREGYINIDGNSFLPKVDLVLDLNIDSLVVVFEPASVQTIIAHDILEHFFHWQAVRLLKDCFAVLKTGGEISIKVPDAEAIIKSDKPVDTKIFLLFGGHDIPQPADKEDHRKRNPHFYCHKYAWTMESLSKEMEKVGFSIAEKTQIGSNILIKGLKLEVS